MGDLISRSALIEDMQKELENAANEDLQEDECKAILTSAIALKSFVNRQPTVDAVPVVHAEWIDTQPEYHDGFHRNAHKCSNCGDYYTTEYDDLFFCPRCGAKMDGEKIQE